MSVSHAVNSAQESGQTITGVQYARYLDSMFGDANLRHIRNDRPSKSLPGGPDMDPDPIRSLEVASLKTKVRKTSWLNARFQLAWERGGERKLNKKETFQLLNHMLFDVKWIYLGNTDGAVPAETLTPAPMIPCQTQDRD